jgi:hypothetical protein
MGSSTVHDSDLQELTVTQPVTVAERSKACTVFARSEAGIMSSNPTQDMDVWCVCAFFCVCVVLCLGRGLATSWSPVQGVLQSVNDQETEKSALQKWEQEEEKKNSHSASEGIPCILWNPVHLVYSVQTACHLSLAEPEGYNPHLDTMSLWSTFILCLYPWKLSCLKQYND